MAGLAARRDERRLMPRHHAPRRHRRHHPERVHARADHPARVDGTGSSTTTAVSRRPPGRVGVEVLVDLAPPGPQPRPLLALAARPVTCQRVAPSSSTRASGCACRFSHHAGSAGPQPFIARVTRFGAVLDVAEHDVALLPGAPPRGRSAAGCPTSLRGRHRPTRPPVHADTGRGAAARQADEPARRQARWALARWPALPSRPLARCGRGRTLHASSCRRLRHSRTVVAHDGAAAPAASGRGTR